MANISRIVEKRVLKSVLFQVEIRYVRVNPCIRRRIGMTDQIIYDIII